MTNRLLTAKWVLILMTFGAILFIASCGGGDDPAGDPQPDPDPEEPLTIADVVASSPDFDMIAQTTTKNEGEETTVTKEDYTKNVDGSQVEERWVCTEREVDVLGGSAEFPLYNPSSAVIWPGNLIQGKTLSDALPTAITVKRGLGKITYDLIDGNTTATSDPIIIDEGTVNQAMNDIVAGNIEVSSNFSLNVKRINSTSELAFEMGLSVETLTTKVDGEFSYNSSKEVSSVLVELKQSYYTMSFVTPTSLEDFFDPSVTAEDLATKIGPDNPAAFIKSVTYGRIFYMLFESTSSAESLEAALRGEYDGLAVEGKFESKLDVFNEFNEVKVKVIAFGGEAEATLGASAGVFNDAKGLQTIITSLAKAGTIGSGKALSYEVYSLKDRDQRLASNLATTYTIKTCEFKGTLAPDNYLELVDLFEDGIGAAVNLTGSKIMVYNKAGDKYALYDASLGKKGETIYDFDKGPISVPNAFGPIGAAFRRDAKTIFLFNTSGTKFITLKSETLSFIQDIADISNFLDCNCIIGARPFGTEGNTSDHFSKANGTTFPFAGNGIDAALEKDEYPEFVFWDGKPVFPLVYYTKSILFSNDGNDGAELEHAVGKGYLWQAKKSTKSLFGSGPSFSTVGAACKVAFSENTIDYLYFNNEGDQMIIQKGAAFTGPYVVN